MSNFALDKRNGNFLFLLQAKDLDDLIKAHSSYVQTLYDRCLLSQKVWCSKLNLAIDKVHVYSVYLHYYIFQKNKSK